MDHFCFKFWRWRRFVLSECIIIIIIIIIINYWLKNTTK